MAMKRYLLFWLAMSSTWLLAVAAFNLVIDPYGLFRLVNLPGLNSIKPAAASHGAMAKAYQVRRIQPRALIMGNSRAEVGFDPEHPAWPELTRPVFNLALPGTGTATSLRYLQHALASGDGAPAVTPAAVVWGIDIADFLVDANTPRRPFVLAHADRRLRIDPSSSASSSRWLQEIRDEAESIFTMGALLNSVQTLRSQKSPYTEDLTPLGFNPMRDYLKITADEGYWNVFRQKDHENIKAYLRRPRDIFQGTGRSSSAWDDFKTVLRLCQQHNIALHLVIYPYHARLQEIIRITGHWPAFEAWKRELVRILDEESVMVTQRSAVLWDFSGFNDITMERIPAQGDRQTKMLWYWEAGHFKRELGDLVLDRVLGRSDVPAGFGVLLNTSRVEAHLVTLRSQEADYRRTYPQDVEALERFAADVAARQKTH